jgi:hypothetical protein
MIAGIASGEVMADQAPALATPVTALNAQYDPYS